MNKKLNKSTFKQLNFISKLIYFIMYFITIALLFIMIPLCIIQLIVQPYNVSKSIKYSSKEEFVNKIIDISQDKKDEDDDSFNGVIIFSEDTINDIKSGEISTNEAVKSYYIANLSLGIELIFAIIIIIKFIIIMKNTNLIDNPFNNETLKRFEESFRLIFLKYVVMLAMSMIGFSLFEYNDSFNNIIEVYSLIETICFYGFIFMFYARKLKNAKNFEE